MRTGYHEPHRARQNAGQESKSETHLACDDGCKGGDDKHGPVDGVWNGVIEGVCHAVWILHQEGCLPQVGDENRWVHNAAVSQLRHDTAHVTIITLPQTGKKSCSVGGKKTFLVIPVSIVLC